MKKYFMLFFIIFYQLTVGAGFKSLSTEINARSAGMGEISSVLPNGSSAQYWNPALLSHVERDQLEFSMAQYLLDTKSYLFSYANAGDRWNIGLFLYFNAITGIEVRDVPSIEPDGETSASDLAVGFSISRVVRKNWNAGISLKYLFTSLYGYQATGIGLDGGITYTGFQHFMLAAGFRNLGKTGTLNNERPDLQEEVFAGVYFPQFFSKDNHDLGGGIQIKTLSVDDNLKKYINIGIEYTYADHLFGRIGYLLNNDLYSATYGLGYQFKRMAIHYSLKNAKHGFNDSHFVTLSMGL